MREKDIDYLKKYLSNDKLVEGIELLKKGISPQYIVGNVCFYGNILNINSNVLIPRFETELLVEKTIKYCKKLFGNNKINILADEIEKFANDNHVNAELYAVSNNDDTVDIAFEVSGDWKHDHLAFDHMVDIVVDEHNGTIEDMNEDVIDEDGSDNYTSIHTFTIKLDDDNTHKVYTKEEFDEVINELVKKLGINKKQIEATLKLLSEGYKKDIRKIPSIIGGDEKERR